MILVVVVTALALAAVVFVIHVEDREGASTAAPRTGSRFDGLDAAGLVDVELPRAVLGYDPVVVREALAAAVRLAEPDPTRCEQAPALGEATSAPEQEDDEDEHGDERGEDERQEAHGVAAAPAGEDDDHA